MKGAGKVIAAGIAAGATAVTAFAKKSIDAGMAFDSSMSNVAAISGAQGQAFDDLRDKALEMGAKTSFSATEAADAFSYMAMAGWKTGDMLDGIEGIMNLAAASGEDLAATSDIVTDALTAFGLQASDSGHFADILAAASSNANTNVGLMGETFKYVAPVAGALGFSAEDTAVAIGLMANAGIKGSQAGTALRSMMTRLVKPTKESQTAMNALGISVTKSDGSMKDFDEVIGDLRGSFANLTESEKAQYAAMLAGQEGMSGLLAIVNASEDDFNDLTEAINKCDGAAEKMAKTRMDNLEGDIKLFNSAMETANITLTDVLKPTLREFVKFGTEGIGRITTAFNENGLNGAMRAFGDVLSDGVALIISFIPTVVDAGTKVFTALVNGIIQNIPLLIQAAGQIGDTFIETLQRELLINMPQVGMVFYDLLETAQTAFNGIITIIQDVFAGDWSAAWNDMMTLVSDVFNGLGDWFLERFNAAKDAITSIDWATVGNSVWNFLKNGIGNVSDWFSENFEAAKKAITEDINWGEAGAAIESAFNLAETAINAVSTAISTVIEWFEKVFETSDSASSFGSTSSNAWGLISTAIDTVSAAIETVSGLFTNIFATGETATAFGGIVKSAWNLIETAVRNVNALLTSAKTFFENVFEKAEPASTFGSAIESAFELVSDAIDAISTAVEIVLGWLQDLFNNQSLAESYGSALQSEWNMVTTAIDGVSTAVNTVIGFFDRVFQKKQGGQIFGKALEKAFGLISAAADLISKAIETVIGWFEDVFSNQETAEAYGDALESVWNLVTTAIDLVSTAISTVIDWFVDLFNNEGPANTFSGALQTAFGIISTAADAISTALNAVIGWLDDLFGEDGPADAFARSIKSAFGKVSDAADAIVSAVKDAVDWLKKLFGYDGKSINVNYNIHKSESGVTHAGGGTKFATAMTGGRILASGAEIFGYDNNGPLIGGEAGPEAIVGTGSLDRMIQASVNIAMNRVLDRLDNIIGAMNSGNTQIVLDTGALVGGIAEEMDAELNRIASWKEGGRA